MADFRILSISDPEAQRQDFDFQQHQLEKKHRLHSADSIFVLSFKFFFSSCHRLCLA